MVFRGLCAEDFPVPDIRQPVAAGAKCPPEFVVQLDRQVAG